MTQWIFFGWSSWDRMKYEPTMSIMYCWLVSQLLVLKNPRYPKLLPCKWRQHVLTNKKLDKSGLHGIHAVAVGLNIFHMGTSSRFYMPINHTGYCSNCTYPNLKPKLGKHVRWSIDIIEILAYVKKKTLIWWVSNRKWDWPIQKTDGKFWCASGWSMMKKLN